MSSVRRLSLFILVLTVFPVAIDAASFLVPTDEEMIRRADAIALARVVESHSVKDNDGRIVTISTLSVIEHFKGTVPQTFQVTELGGIVGDRGLAVAGSALYSAGEEALVFLEKSNHGFRTWGMLLGKFQSTESGLLTRGSGEEVFGWDEGTWNRHVERPRIREQFLRYVRTISRGESATPDYFASSEAKHETAIRVMNHFPAEVYARGSDQSAVTRWTEFDASQNVQYDAAGLPSGAEVAAAQGAMGIWSGAGGSNIGLDFGAVTTGTFDIDVPPSDGKNTIVFNSTKGISGTTVGFAMWSFCTGGCNHPKNGSTFARIIEGDVSIKAGLSGGILIQVVAHEVGHTLGFRHSNMPSSPSEPSGGGIMNSSASGVTSAQQWDQEAANHIYGDGSLGGGPPPCTPPSISIQPVSRTIVSGASANLSVSATGTTPLTFQWFRGSSGDTSQPIGGATSASFNTGALTSTTSFWVRVTGQCAPAANSATATITVTPPGCAPPGIASHPQSQTIQSGQTASLVVGAIGTGTLTYQWFRGGSGDTNSPVSAQTASNEFTTPVLTQTSFFWVRVSDSCGSHRDSNTATITVTTTPPPCQPVQITSQPQNKTITAGQTTSLSFGASGTQPFTIQWFEGDPGNTTKPVPGGTSFSISVAPGATTKYWVQIRNACTLAGLNSSAATVTVTIPCPTGHLCLMNGRFRLALFARDQRTGNTASGQPVPENDVFGFFSLATLTGSGEIPEVFVKMIDATSLPGSKFWIFYGGLTDLEYTLVVTDTKNGQQKQYAKAPGSLCGGVDLSAFTLVEDPDSDMLSSAPEDLAVEPAFTCGANSLCLLATRFDVSLTARDQRTGNTAVGRPVAKNDLFGYFSLVELTGDSRNPEVFVKLLDATAPPFQKFWFFHGGLTDLEYTITVRDNARGVTKTYQKEPGSFCGEADTAAFNP